MTQSALPEISDYSLIRGGLVHRLLTRAGLAESGLVGLRLRIAWLICLTYMPMLVLSLVQGVAFGPALKIPFLLDISECCRFLLVGPVLVAAEVIIEPWLRQVVKQVRSRLIPHDELPRFEHLVAGAGRWQDSYFVEISLFIATFALQWIELHVAPVTIVSTWHELPSTGTPTYAWFWLSYFAKPLIKFIWLRWLWRYLIWSLFLVRLASLPLKIVPTHPDHDGGLAFIAVGHVRFSALAFAFSLQASSILATNILFEGRTLMSFKYEIVGVVVFCLMLVLTPLLAFTRQLLNARRIGLFDYGSLANEYAAKFHAKWIVDKRGDEQLLGTSDIQSLADLSNMYAVVREINFCLIDKTNVMIVAAVALVPFVPLLLTVYPFDELVKNVLKLVF